MSGSINSLKQISSDLGDVTLVNLFLVAWNRRRWVLLGAILGTLLGAWWFFLQGGTYLTRISVRLPVPPRSVENLVDSFNKISSRADVSGALCDLFAKSAGRADSLVFKGRLFQERNSTRSVLSKKIPLVLSLSPNRNPEEFFLDLHSPVEVPPDRLPDSVEKALTIIKDVSRSEVVRGSSFYFGSKNYSDDFILPINNAVASYRKILIPLVSQALDLLVAAGLNPGRVDGPVDLMPRVSNFTIGSTHYPVLPQDEGSIVFLNVVRKVLEGLAFQKTNHRISKDEFQRILADLDRLEASARDAGNHLFNLQMVIAAQRDVQFQLLQRNVSAFMPAQEVDLISIDRMPLTGELVTGEVNKWSWSRSWVVFPISSILGGIAALVLSGLLSLASQIQEGVRNKNLKGDFR